MFNQFKKKTSCGSDNINITDWKLYYSDLYSILDNCTTPVILTTLSLTTDPDLDLPITLYEVTEALSHCNKNSKPGADGICFDLFNNLPGNWLLYLTGLFNKIFDTGDIPTDWSEIITILLYKKGPKENLANYRGISLINCCVKLFTSILNKRLTDWIEKYDLIPEVQAGFRKGKSCIDNIFILNSITQNHLRLPKRKIVAAFIDFRKAFDTIIHVILFNKLKILNLSNKILSLIMNLYEKAFTKVKYNNQFSEPIKILRGLLQGEISSPNLFNLFIADMIEFFRSKGVSGISINDIILLLFCDDLILLAESEIDMNKKLNILKEYCELNGIEVNLDKSKIVMFSKGPLSKNRPKIYYDNKILEVVPKFNYLGVCFSKKGVFEQAMKQAVSRSRSASAVIKDSLSRAKNSSFEAVLKIFNACILPTLTYGAAVWALRYLEELEAAQNFFFKNYYSLQKNVPHYIIRLEFNIPHVSVLVLRLSLNWVTHIHQSNPNSLIKLCFDRLKYLDSVPSNTKKYNWYTQLKEILNTLDIDTEAILSGPINDSILQDILNRYQILLRKTDIQKIQNSSYSSFYKILNSISNFDTNYLSIDIPYGAQKILAQIRTSGFNILKISFKGIMYRIKTDVICTLCNNNQLEDLYHILFICPNYSPFRDHYLDLLSLTDLQNNDTKIASTLCVNLKKQGLNLTLFFRNVLQLRSQLINE